MARLGGHHDFLRQHQARPDVRRRPPDKRVLRLQADAGSRPGILRCPSVLLQPERLRAGEHRRQQGRQGIRKGSLRAEQVREGERGIPQERNRGLQNLAEVRPHLRVPGDGRQRHPDDIRRLADDTGRDDPRQLRHGQRLPLDADQPPPHARLADQRRDALQGLGGQDLQDL